MMQNSKVRKGDSCLHSFLTRVTKSANCSKHSSPFLVQPKPHKIYPFACVDFLQILSQKIYTIGFPLGPGEFASVGQRMETEPCDSSLTSTKPLIFLSNFG